MINLLLLLTIVFLGSLNSIGIKIGLGSFSPILFTFLRFLISFVILSPFVKWKTIFNFNKAKKAYLVSIFAVSNVILFAYGIHLSTVISSSVISTTIPVLVGVISHFTLGTVYRKNEILGAVVGFGGTLYVVLLPILEKSIVPIGTFLGNIFLLAAMVSFAIYTAMSKSLHINFSKKEFTVIFFFLAWTSNLILLIIDFTRYTPLLISNMTLPAIAGLAFSATFGTVGFYLLYQKLISRAGSLFASFFLYLNPVVSALLATLLLKERPSGSIFIGAALTFLGVWIYGKK